MIKMSKEPNEHSIIHIPLWIVFKLQCRKSYTSEKDLQIYFSYFSVITFHLFAVYLFLISSIFRQESVYFSNDIKLRLTYAFTNFFTVVLWYSLLQQKNNIEVLVCSLKTYAKLSGKCVGKNYRRKLKVLLLFIFTIPILLSFVYIYQLYDLENPNLCTFGYIIHDKRHRAAINFICSYAYMSNTVGIPLLCVFSACLVIHRYGILLLHYHRNLKRTYFSNVSARCAEIVNDYNRIEEKLRLLRNAFSKPLFFMLLIGILELYSAFSAVVLLKIHTENVLELCCNACTGIIVIFSLGFFSCRIPEYMMEVKESIGFLIDRNKAKRLFGTDEISDLSRIEKKDIAYLTAYGGLQFKRGFILSIMGSLLTYGLLISNLNISVWVITEENLIAINMIDIEGIQKHRTFAKKFHLHVSAFTQIINFDHTGIS